MAIFLPALVLSWKKSFGGIINFKPASPQNRDFSVCYLKSTGQIVYQLTLTSENQQKCSCKQ